MYLPSTQLCILLYTVPYSFERMLLLPLHEKSLLNNLDAQQTRRKTFPVFESTGMLTSFFKCGQRRWYQFYSFLKFLKQASVPNSYRSDIGIDLDKRVGLYQCFRSALVSIRIRIQGAKPMRINEDPDPGQTLPSHKNHVSLGPYKKC